MKTAPMEWTVAGVTHVKVSAVDKEAIKKLKDMGVVLECAYFTNTGIKKYHQYSYRKPKQKDE